MVKAILAAALVISAAGSAHADWRDGRGGRGGGHGGGHGGGGWDRGVSCRIITTHYNIYEARGRDCRDAQENVIAECIAGQRANGVSNWDRCEHARRPGNKYTMRCTDGCGY